MEPFTATFLVFGVLLLVASWVYLLIVSFEHDFTWGLATLFLPPLSYFFALLNWAKAKEPIYLAVIGGGLLLLGW